MPKGSARDWVAILLALGFASSLNLITAGVLYDAIFSKGPGLSSNATQVLVMGFGGIIGILGSYFGFKAGQAANGQPQPEQGVSHGEQGSALPDDGLAAAAPGDPGA